MGSRLGRRVIHFANLPIKLLMPTPPFDRIREIALKTIPSASKIEIRRVLESLYGFEVDEVRTLNMEGKKTKRGGFLAAKPDYKKAYVTLRYPLSISPDLFPIRMIQEEQDRVAQASSKPAVVEGGARSHWLDDPDRDRDSGGRHRHEKRHGGRRAPGERRSVGRDAGGVGGRGRRSVGKDARGAGKDEESKFPWSSMHLGR